MKCKNPYNLQLLKDTPLNKAPHQELSFFVPCGKCLYCRIQRRKEWSIRLMHENQCHEKSCFITLTYSDEHVPTLKNGLQTLEKKVIQDFFRLLRKEGYKFKYFMAGEYGSQTQRPHYHILFFGQDFGETETLEYYWPFGMVDYGHVSPDSIRYVAQYLDKKVYGEKSQEWYNGRLPEYQLQSQGLGLSWLLQEVDNILEDHFIRFRSGKAKVPRYYLKKIEQLIGEQEWRKWKNKYKNESRLKDADFNSDILGYQAPILKDLDMKEQSKVLTERKRIGKQADMNLKAQAKIHALQKKHKI